MAIVVLFSTMSFAIDMHYCGDTLVETAIFQKAVGCEMDMNSLSTKECSVTEKNCCENEQLVVDGQDNLQFSADKVSFNQDLFIASFVFTYNTRFKGIEEKPRPYEKYTAPLVVKEIFKLDETYLI